MSDQPAIRDAATVIVLRKIGEVTAVLMGQRGKSAAFMPNKYVFPGGAVDASDHSVPLAGLPKNACLARLANQSNPDISHALIIAAIRELWEETGFILGTPASANTASPAGLSEDWQQFHASGLEPNGQGLEFVFRAITPKGRPRRFDARFFLIDAAHIRQDLDDFSQASDELSHLQWVPLADARQFDLPFITEVVLAEMQARLHQPDKHHPVPFFTHEEGRSEFRRL